jgi:hypothetical protein
MDFKKKEAVNERDIGRMANVYLISHPPCTIHGITFCPMGSSYSLLRLVRYGAVLMNLCGDTKQF